jgi:hypothetical protein
MQQEQGRWVTIKQRFLQKGAGESPGALEASKVFQENDSTSSTFSPESWTTVLRVRAECGIPIKHNPVVPIVDKHHWIPKRYGGLDEKWNLVPRCPNCHRLEHMVWELWIALQREPTAQELRGIPRSIRTSVKGAISKRGSIPKK